MIQSMTWMALGCWLTGLILTIMVTPMVRRWAIQQKLMDRSGQLHMTHSTAVPRMGGLALLIAFDVILGFQLLFSSKRFIMPVEMQVVFWTSGMMFTIGFIDDLRPLGAKFKLAGQILVSICACWGGLRIVYWVNPFTDTIHLLGWMEIPLTVIWLVSVTNLINLVDGIDGLATGLSLILMVLLALLSGLSANYFSMFLCVGMSGCLIGFLYYNFPPAKIFLGDGGAYFLGFLIGELALLNAHKGDVLIALAVPFFAMGLPIIDTCFTILRRGILGLPIFRADRSHIHHRVVAMGFSRTRVVLLLYAVCVFFSLLSLGVFVEQGRWLPLFFGLFMIIAVMSARVFGFIQDWFKLGSLLSSSLVRRKNTRYILLLGKVLLMESERSRTLDELWNHYGQMLTKLSVKRCIWKNSKGEWQWPMKLEASKSSDRTLVQEVRGGASDEMAFTFSESQFDEDELNLMTELLMESWVKARESWESRQLNR